MTRLPGLVHQSPVHRAAQEGKYVVNPVVFTSFFGTDGSHCLGSDCFTYDYRRIGYQPETKKLLAQAESQHQHLQVEFLRLAPEYVGGGSPAGYD